MSRATEDDIKQCSMNVDRLCRAACVYELFPRFRRVHFPEVAIASLFAALTAVATPAWYATQAQGLLVEAESFDDHGGWVLDTQFIEIMGRPT